MRSFKEVTEDIAQISNLAKQLVLKASKRAWTRVLLMAVVGILVMGSYSAYLTYLMNEHRKISENKISEYVLLAEEARDQKTLDHLELCISATNSNDNNREYYCNKAVAVYAETFTDTPNNGVSENIKRSAYGLMKVEVSNKIRVLALERATGNPPTMDKTLKFLLSSTGISIAILAGLLAMVSSIFMSYRLSTPTMVKGKDAEVKSK